MSNVPSFAIGSTAAANCSTLSSCDPTWVWTPSSAKTALRSTRALLPEQDRPSSGLPLGDGNDGDQRCQEDEQDDRPKQVNDSIEAPVSIDAPPDSPQGRHVPRRQAVGLHRAFSLIATIGQHLMRARNERYRASPGADVRTRPPPRRTLDSVAI